MYAPDADIPHVTGGPLFEKVADLLELASSRARIVEEVAQLARVWLQVGVVLLMTRIALEHQDLVFGTTSLSE
jgi:hypothetical protein